MVENDRELFEEFVGKNCKLRLKNGFILIGCVISITELGIFFQTNQAKSFISFSDISSLTQRDY